MTKRFFRFFPKKNVFEKVPLHGPQAVENTVVTVENALQLVKKGSFHLPPIDPAVEAIMRDWRQPWRNPWT